MSWSWGYRCARTASSFDPARICLNSTNELKSIKSELTNNSKRFIWKRARKLILVDYAQGFSHSESVCSNQSLQREEDSYQWTMTKNPLIIFSGIPYSLFVVLIQLWGLLKDGSKAGKEVSPGAPSLLSAHPHPVAQASWSGEAGGGVEGGAGEQRGEGDEQQQGGGGGGEVDEQAAAVGEEGTRVCWLLTRRAAAAKFFQQQSNSLSDCGCWLVPPLLHLQLPRWSSTYLHQLPLHLCLKLSSHLRAASTFLSLAACTNPLDAQPGRLRFLPTRCWRVCQWGHSSSCSATFFWLPGVLWQVAILF